MIQKGATFGYSFILSHIKNVHYMQLTKSQVVHVCNLIKKDKIKVKINVKQVIMAPCAKNTP